MTFHPTTTHTSTSSNNWPIGTAITLPIHDKVLECTKDGLIETAGKSLITKIWKTMIPILLVLAASGSILATVVVVVCLSRCRKHRGYEDEMALYMRSRNCVVCLGNSSLQKYLLNLISKTSGRPFLMSPGSPVRFESYYGSDVATPIRVHTNNKYVLSPV